MLRNIKALAIVAAAAGVTMMAVPTQASAQGKSGKSQGKAHAAAHSSSHAKSQNRSVVQVTKSKNGNGPSFCRSGAGHPQFGRQWCLDKGFGLGNSSWGNAGWGDVILHRKAGRSTNVGSGTLSDILGRVIFGRLQSQSNGGALSGLWLTPATGPVVLQVQSGGRPFAEFVDRNRDGRAEVVLLNLRR